MNKQRKVLITTTYNEMGIVIDTKAEEVAQPEILACGEGELNVPDTNVGDTISRQAALDALWKALFKYEDDAEKQFQESDELDVSEWIAHRTFVQNMSDIDRQTIRNLPPAQPEQRWIPCSERMPNKYGEYMFTWVTSYMPNKRFIGIAEYEVTDEWDTINGRWNGRWLFEDYIQSCPDVKVLAWMPLPEPYEEKGGKNNGDY